MLRSMKLILDAFWRAAAYCLHPRVIALSLLPLVLMAALALGLNYFFWEQALASINAWLLSSDWLMRGIGWLESMGLGGLKAAIAPLILIVAITPVLVVVSLLFVAFMMTPAMVKLVALRRFAQLERKRGAGMVSSVLWSLAVTAVALLALLISIPLWFIPPLVLLIPPLIWGWLTYRVMAFDTLAEHASKEERKQIMREHRMPLLGIGVVSGYLGAAPALLWASGVLFLVLAPILIVVAIWIYTLVFAFSSLWFAHYCLAALEQMRSENLKQNEPSDGMKYAPSAPELIVDVQPKPVLPALENKL
ncbi:MAG: EI24 domain-containing protein [Brachymonas sp.]|nr:EI24 domain-containing protein [Brachymonas sp.]